MAAWLFLFGGLLSLSGVAYAYSLRKMPGALPLFALFGLSGIIMFASGREELVSGLADKLLWRNVQQIGYLYAPLSVLWLALTYTREGSRFTRQTIALILAIPTTGLLLIFTDSFHRLMRVQVYLNEAGMLVIQRTVLNQAIYGFSLLVSLVGLFVLVRSVFYTRGVQRRQLLYLIVGMYLPSVLAFLRGAGLVDFQGYTASIGITYLPGLLIVGWGVLRYHLFDSVPFPRNRLFDMMSEGIVVLDADGRLQDLNGAARRMLRMEGGLWHGKLVADTPLPSERWLAAHRDRVEIASFDFALGEGEDERQFTAKITPILHRNRILLGSLSVLTDRTEERRRELALRQAAVTDGLTGIYNRNGFISELTRLLEIARERGTQLSLLVLDIDSFKSVNDRFGHLTGDRTIRAFVDSVLKSAGELGLFGRIGGEEFALALPGMTAEDAFECAESVRREVSHAVIADGLGGTFGITASIGVATLRAEDRSFESLYSRADAGLYEAKHLGRNATREGGRTPVHA
ncbi:diguanylate cyclase [Cohnella sp. GCM10012308]|uniref:histidine kinase N-terminal 7TM domain-containing diguanylate cyclase n=1 Tax=Cohnella sp. GCM10012308 TaxID=3317329 RepID=UPI0036191ACA